MLRWLLVGVLVVLLSERERRGAVGQFTTACLSGNTFGPSAEASKDCLPPVNPLLQLPGFPGSDKPLSRCEPNALLPIVDHPERGNFGQCLYNENAELLLQIQQEIALNDNLNNSRSSDTAGDVTASGENQSILCGQPSGVNRTDITDLGTAALGSCPSDKPICARTSESRFCYCIKDDRGLFGEAAEVSHGDVTLAKGVVSGKPSSLCLPPELDPCFNAVNRFAVPFDCADSLPVVERREDIGPDPRNQSWLPNERFPVPQESTFAQLVPGTYLFEDVHSNAYLDTIKNVGTGVSSCMRIQGKKNDDIPGGVTDFVEFACSSVRSLLQLKCKTVDLLLRGLDADTRSRLESAVPSQLSSRKGTTILCLQQGNKLVIATGV
ncbi:unnamed protein product [Vitrella brassicaformis CCMP3155]|uniref:Thyroglobulin type-1 domain-containing protein n=1 Tax=Vitrella brassicaformis (strain CCMP3155) TaxID=1169540 RepID=A0A0G4GR74_VITBC|nr:unnamed protein product [Vitrella brassicaformis CCMP3155]|eukprot:CEM33033.1 unnamed protein product [Vitrella brassicaformis CCMP3155]